MRNLIIGAFASIFAIGSAYADVDTWTPLKPPRTINKSPAAASKTGRLISCRDQILLLNMSGRGDKDIFSVMDHLGAG